MSDRLIGAFIGLIVAICFLGGAYSIGYEKGMKSECERNGGIIIDMMCIDKSFLLKLEKGE